jgi:hypothetical protein
MGCFLEYIYTGEYFPQKIAGQRGLVKDLTMPDIDETGEQLLKHARVYTLADKLGMSALKTLAHSKIHCVNSSAKGEIAYARYVYATTPKEDDTIRRPVASFWAHRSHVLRREADDEFRQMCLEFPQFAFDVLCQLKPGLVTLLLLLMCFTSARFGREAQERRRRRQADYGAWQFSQTSTAESGLKTVLPPRDREMPTKGIIQYSTNAGHLLQVPVYPLGYCASLDCRSVA